MAQADGSIIIDTEINSDGMSAGGREIESSLRKMANELNGVSAKTKASIEKQIDSFSKLSREYARQSEKVEELKRKVAEYGNQKIPTEEYREIQAQIDQATAKMNRLTEAQERFLANGGKKNSNTYKKQQYDIDELANTIKYAEGELKDLEASGTAFRTGTGTKEAKADDLDKALTQEDIFNRLTNNGQVQGLFLKDGKIYLNFSYAEGGTLKLGGKANEQGVLEVYHSAGWKSMSIDNEGLKTYGGQKIISYIDGVDDYGKFTAYVKLQGGVDVSMNRDGPSVVIEPQYIRMIDYTGTEVASLDANYEWSIRKNVSITGDFSVTGKKSRAVNTKSYSRRLLNAYETPAPMFGDVGEGTIGVDGKCYISIDPIFLETIASGCKYQVFLQKNGKGDVWVSERHETYFVVEGTESLNFSWEIKARQKDYEYDRIDVYNENVEERDIDYAYIGEMEYQNYVDTMQAEV